MNYKVSSIFEKSNKRSQRACSEVGRKFTARAGYTGCFRIRLRYIDYVYNLIGLATIANLFLDCLKLLVLIPLQYVKHHCGML